MAYKNWIVKNNIALGLIPKNGSTSFRNALATSQTITGDEAMQYATRVIFVRDPIERFNSAYSFFYYLNDTNQNGQSTNITKTSTHNGYDHWVDFALSTNNAHWFPQTKIMEGRQTIAHRFNLENIQKYWPKYWPGKRPDWLNATTGHLPSNDYRKADILEFYKDDIALFNSTQVI